MRRPLRTLIGTCATVGALVGAGALAQAPAQSPEALTLETTSFQILQQDSRDADATPAYVLRQGQRYQFRIHYKVAGASSIRTGHTFAFEHIESGRRVDVDSRSFDPEGPGNYNEYSARTIPPDWTPGTYRLVWDLRATAVDAASAHTNGTVTFLLAGPAAG